MSLKENLAKVRERMERACQRANRDPESVVLVAVSKNQSADRVAEAVDCGLTLFGENRVQEAKTKIPLSPGPTRWHFIGHLQSNKARDAASLFDMIQSVDSLELGAELQKQAEKQARTLRVMLEVNVAGESSKFGWHPEKVLAELSAFNQFNRLELHGLMTVAPYSTEAEKVRPVFRRLRELRDRCADQLGAPLPELSMGMSGDLEVAIEEGATLVRIGTALFGPRIRSRDTAEAG